MKKTVFLTSFLLVCFAIISSCFGDQKLLVMHVAGSPVIDGFADDPAWKNSQEIITLDKSNKLPLTVKAVYNDKEIFVQICFSDPDESNSFY